MERGQKIGLGVAAIAVAPTAFLVFTPNAAMDFLVPDKVVGRYGPCEGLDKCFDSPGDVADALELELARWCVPAHSIALASDESPATHRSGPCKVTVEAKGDDFLVTFRKAY